MAKSNQFMVPVFVIFKLCKTTNVLLGILGCLLEIYKCENQEHFQQYAKYINKNSKHTHTLKMYNFIESKK